MKKLLPLILLVSAGSVFANGNSNGYPSNGTIGYQECPEAIGDLKLLRTEPGSNCVYYSKSVNPKDSNMKAMVTITSPDSNSYQMQTLVAECGKSKLSIGKAITFTEAEAKGDSGKIGQALKKETVATVKEVPIKSGSREELVYKELCGK